MRGPSADQEATKVARGGPYAPLRLIAQYFCDKIQIERLPLTTRVLFLSRVPERLRAPPGRTRIHVRVGEANHASLAAAYRLPSARYRRAHRGAQLLNSATSPFSFALPTSWGAARFRRVSRHG